MELLCGCAVVNLNRESAAFAPRRESAVWRKVWRNLHKELVKDASALRELKLFLKTKRTRRFWNERA
jgi:hypothetical protein